MNKDGHRTNRPEGTMLMLDEITKSMNDRYAQMNANPDDEADITYCEKSKDKGYYLLVIDEILTHPSSLYTKDSRGKHMLKHLD